MAVRFGKGFSERNLRNMRAFYLNFPIRQTVSAESIEKRKSQIPFGKSKTVSRKFTIPQTASAKFEKARQCLANLNQCSLGRIILNC